MGGPKLQPSDDVVVIFTDDRKIVKELLYIRDGSVTLGSMHNGHGNITAELGQIDKMHYVAAIIPRGAFYKSEPDEALKDVSAMIDPENSN